MRNTLTSPRWMFTMAAALAATLTAFAIAIALGWGTSGSEAAEGSSDDSLAAVLANEKIEINASGQTYGSGLLDPDNPPVLIKAIGDNGEEGYVYEDQLAGPPVASPEEAVEYMKTEAARQPTVLVLYASDGKTPIGTFTLEPAAGVTEANPR